jgi:hypothetical protein
LRLRRELLDTSTALALILSDPFEPEAQAEGLRENSPEGRLSQRAELGECAA